MFHHSCPNLFKRWLTNAFVDTLDRFENPEERLVFVNAWNEWAEGAHLEPDQRYGYAWLQAVTDAHKAALLGNAKHAAVLNVRWNKLESLFGAMPSREICGFLIDYEALFRQAARKGWHFFIKEGVPVCSIDGETIFINSRSDVSLISDEVYTKGSYCFVILQYNNSDLTSKCVDSIKRIEKHGQDLRIVIVDNGSKEHHVEAIKQAYQCDKDVTLIFSGKNLGFSGGNNLGYRYARNELGAKFCVVLNNDTEIEQSDFIKKSIELFESYSYSIAGPDVVLPDGRRENPWNDYIYSIKEFRKLKAKRIAERENYLEGRAPSFKKIGKCSPNNDLLYNPLLQGAAFIISPIFIADHGVLFDERLFLYGEEFLLATECLLSGHLMLYSDQLKVKHLEGATTATLQHHEKIMLGYGSAIKSMDLCLQRLERQRDAVEGIVIPLDDDEYLDNLLAVEGPHVLIDLFFCQPGYHGGGEYGKAVFKKLVERYASIGGFQLWVAMNPYIFIDRWVWDVCKAYGINIVDVRSYGDIIRLVNSDRFDSFFTPAIVVYTGYEYMNKVGTRLPFTCKKTRVIGTLHDIRDFELAMNRRRIIETRKRIGCKKELAMTKTDIENEVESSRKQADQLRKMYRAIIQDEVVDHVVTISKYCENSIQTNIGNPVKPMKVLWSPMKPRPKPAPFESNNPHDFSSMRYVLLIHAGREEKNAAAAIAVLDRIFSESEETGSFNDLKVVLTGVNSIEEVGLSNIDHSDRFICLGEVPAEQFEYLLANSELLVYPSFNEGFGYPPIEAMSYGIPCVVSNTTAIPEVCGDAVMYFDPYDVDAIYGSLVTGIGGAKKDLIQKRFDFIREKQIKDLDALVALITKNSEANSQDNCAVLTMNRRR